MYCPKCGQEVGDYTQICPSCGELLDNDSVAEQNQNVSQTQEQNQYPGQDQSQYQYSDQNQYQNQYQNYAPEPPVDKIPDYKVQSILLIVFSSVLCCVTCLSLIALPFAIVALVNSNKIAGHIAAGNYDLALKASADTKKWCWVSFGILLATVVIGIVLSIVMLSSGFYNEFMNEFLNQYEYYY
ncbi:MAG: hypothetical protein GX283_03990 [Clostridiaceae bacterium]|jgi:hypothetical protein|nr:hypothetical protein [Clostridiaceae bacterium]